MLAAAGCGGSTSPNAPSASPPAEGLATADNPKPPEALYNDWHEDLNASTDERSVFVPKSVDLGPARFRPSLHFGRDGSFSTLRLDPADAHYECAGTFVAVSKDALEAQCRDPKKQEPVKISIQLLEVTAGKLTVKISP